MELTDADIAAIPVRNLRVPRAEFTAVWIAAERLADGQSSDWYTAGVVTTCRWLANATVRPESGLWRSQCSPVTQRDVSAYEELIEAECLAAEVCLVRRPPHVWLRTRPGWVEAIAATLNWAWRRSGAAPLTVATVTAG